MGLAIHRVTIQVYLERENMQTLKDCCRRSQSKHEQVVGDSAGCTWKLQLSELGDGDKANYGMQLEDKIEQT